ncbi:ankyrin repeat domain-containing protein 49 [Diachasma alloeum]|uniref:ankyrin repeat domain-containing protein 49 n=1 Tax=Diachasma alloeum TaxID=454923 RepID=UPI0007384974|nr:ankyrin repeat domain-containing protein 49 [Diachasma alloeum]XP_015121936.1 ankyrin repeat domain-containing protein 49 [Diachasma alloeum]
MSSDEENDEIQDLEKIRDKFMSLPQSERMQVSAWEDDNDGIDSQRNPKDADARGILVAAEKGHAERLAILLDKNPALISVTDKDGYTPLHRACYGNHVNIIEYLLLRGAKIDAKTIDGWEPLHSACCWNNVNSISMLVSNGANVNAVTNGGQSPLHLVSASSHNSPALQFLLLHPDTNKTLVNSSGDTPQMIATRTGKYYPIFEMIEPCLNEI